MKKIIKKLFSNFLLLVFVFLLFKIKVVLAVDFSVTCAQDGPCTMVPDKTPLFYEKNWLPGDSVTRTITFINEDSRYSCPLTLETYNQKQTPSDFATKLLTQIVDRSNGVLVYGGGGKTLNDLYQAGIISLGNIPASGTKYFDWTVTFDPLAGNNYQAAETVFDFDLIFSCGSPLPTPTPSPTPASPTPASPIPSSPTPGASPLVFTPFSLGGFFGQLLGVSEASPASVLSEKPLTATESAALEEVLGEATCKWWYYLWWFPLIVQLCLTGIYYYWLKNKEVAAWWSLPVILSALSQIIHEILGCECVLSKLCPWYWLFNLIIFSFLTLFYWWKRKKDKEEKTLPS